MTSQERILSAAKSVFHSKGFEGARMQEIADVAGVNKALVHYYYRNKEKLFDAVFEDAFLKLIARVTEILSATDPIQKKVETFLDYYLTFLSQNSYLPIFILHGLNTRPDQLKAILKKRNFSPQALMDQMKKQVKEEMNLDIDPLHTYINVLALCVFPVIARPLIEQIFGFSSEKSEKFYSDRKTTVPEFILNALKGYEIKSVNNG